MAMAAATATAKAGLSILSSQPFNYNHFLSLNPPRTLGTNKSAALLLFTSQEKPSHNHHLRLRPIVPKAADSTQPATADKSLVTDDEFSLAKNQVNSFKEIELKATAKF